MSYTKITNTKFTRNQHVDIFNNNNILTVKCKQDKSTPGIRMNNIQIQKGTYNIVVDIETNQNQIVLWIQNTETKTEQKTFITDGVNKIEMLFEVDVNMNIGILFVAPSFASQFTLKTFAISKKEDDEQQIQMMEFDAKSIIEHTYVINLDTRSDRLFRTDRYLKKINFSYERIPGVVPSYDEFDNIKKEGSNITSIGALGCIKSHINVLRNAIKNQYKSILILEDDIVPIKTFDLKNTNIPKEWDILYLGCSQHNCSSQQLKMYDNYYVAKKSRGTFAYIVKNHMFHILLSMYSLLEMNVDMYLEGIQNKYKCYVVKDNLMIADLNDSDITTRRDIEQYGKKFGWNNRKYYAEVSIILPIFNGANYLSECLESIKRQTFKDIELVIVNDGSTDDTEKKLREFFVANPDMTISYIEHTTNKGLPSALNSGLLNAHGIFITWISHDNVFKQDAIQKMRDFLCYNKQFSLVTAGHENITDNFLDHTQVVDNKKKILSVINGIEYNSESIINQFHGVASFMYTRNVIEKIGFYDEELFGVEDYDYLIRILELPPYKSGCVRDILCEFRRHPEQLTHKFKDQYGTLKRKMMEKREKRLTTKNTNITERIIGQINDSKDTIVYPPIVNYDLLFQRPQQILKNMTNMCNCIFITKDNDETCEKICDGVIVLSLEKFNELREKILRNNIILYYTDPRSYDFAKELNPNYVVFDLIDNPIGEFSCWMEKLPSALKMADLVIYSAKYLYNVIDEIRVSNSINLKNEPIYLSNCCERTLCAKLNDVMLPKPDDIKTNKKVVGYYGAISTWLDYDIIRTIADNNNIHVVMIGLLSCNKKYCMKFEHPNITWIEHKDYTEIPKYLNRFDICMIPFLNSEMMKGCNPLKLYEYMSSRKPIISTIKFQDYQENYYMVDKNNVNTIINRLISKTIIINYQDIPYWDNICNELYRNLLQIKRKSTKCVKKCAYVTNMLVDWTTYEPRYGGGEKYALTIAKLLKEYNIEVHFYQLANATMNTYYYDFPVHCINMNGLETYQEFNIGYSKCVNNIIKKEKYDYVIYGMPEMCCSENVCNNAISINHGIWFDRNTIKKDQQWFECMTSHIKYPCMSVSVDTNFINFVRALYPEYVSKLNYIPNFYDPKSYKYIEKNNTRLNILIPRRANMYRGSRIMEDILKYVTYDVDFVWVGKGDNEDNKILETLEHIDKRFKFTGCSFEDMHKFYDKADIVVIPTIASEGTSLSCIEAMASGCAVVSTNVGGLCNLVTDNYNGLLVNPTAIDIAIGINKLIENEMLRLMLVRNAKQMIELYSEDEWKEKWCNIFAKMGWIYTDQHKYKNMFITIGRKDIEKNFSTYWKNYIHTYELQQKIKTIDDAYEHFLVNEECKELAICNPGKKIAVLTRHAINGGVESIIAEEAKFMNMDIYITNGIVDKMNPFLFENVKDIDDIIRVVKKYDIILYHWLPEFAVQAIKLSGIPAIEYLHRRDTDNNDKNVPVTIVTHSPFLINHCCTKYNKRCELLEHPIDTEKFKPSQTNEKYIGCFCTYSPIKGIDILIDALHKVKYDMKCNDIDKYKIVFFGKNQENYKNVLTQKANDFGIVCEFRDSVNTWEYINNYELFIIPSRQEGLPIVLLEAISCNKPIIVSNLEGVTEFANMATTRGYDNLFQTFENENINDLTQKIYEWLKNPFQCTCGHEYIEKYYSNKIHCNKISNIINRYVNNYQTENDKIICSEISNYERCMITAGNNIEKLMTFTDVIISYDQFARIIIKLEQDSAKFKRIEVLLDVFGIITPVPVGYQFDIIGNNKTTYNADTVTISNNGIKSICSSELELMDASTIQINIRPNTGSITINGLSVIAYY